MIHQHIHRPNPEDAIKFFKETVRPGMLGIVWVPEGSHTGGEDIEVDMSKIIWNVQCAILGNL